MPAGVELVPLADLDDPLPVYELDLELSRDIPNEEFDAIELEEWKAEFWKGPLIDEDASLVVLVDGELAGTTMIRLDRPSGRAQNNLCWRPAALPRQGARAPPQVAQPPSRGRARSDDRHDRQRRDQRTDARGERQARLPAVRTAAGVGALPGVNGATSEP